MESILQRLTELDEIANAILIGKDGLIVAGALQSEDEELLGATSAAVFDSLVNFTNQASYGSTRHAIIETERGAIQFAEVGDMLLVVTTNTGSNLGRVRMEMKKACHKISQLVAAY
jgi:uncharacterized protein